MRGAPAASVLAALAALATALGARPAAARGEAPGITVYAAGDIARCAYKDAGWSGAAGTAATIASGLARDPDAVVLALGDLTYPRGTAAEFRDCYAPTWGRFKERTWPVPGNHEYYTPGAAPYFAYFGARAAPDGTGRGYYSLRLGGWHLIALDSNLKPAEHAAQLDWLRAALATAEAEGAARCTLAFWHHPLYSSGGHGSIPKMREAWRLLHAAGAELVLSGHDHDYERFAPLDADGRPDRERGLRQFVVGTGGAYPTPFLWPRPHSEVRDASRFGVLRLRLLDGRYEWEFVESARVTDLGVPPPDRGGADCHRRPARRPAGNGNGR